MTDLALHLGNYTADLMISNQDLTTDQGLETAVIISLFTDRRAEKNELLNNGAEQRGWWGDRYLKNTNDHIGSKLWLLQREKMTAATLHRAKAYTEEALKWLVDDKVAQTINVGVTPTRVDAILIHVDIIRPNGEAVNFDYNLHWQAQSNSKTSHHAIS